LRKAKIALLAIFTLSCPVSLAAQYSVLETDNLRLIYDDILYGYLAPHAARCFENAMEFYTDVFDYTPAEKVTVFLADVSDYNNAAAWSVPRNSLLVQIAPTNTVFETSPSNESINHTMNHELCHIVAVDKAAGSDRVFRALFAGKVRQTQEHPETILYSYMTHPRRSAPRWFHEGIAVFLETWMAGGIGRAQGPYDEMVFRSMVRDGSRFYDPLGLESEGTKIDFQVGVNAYLYGTRFMSYLAYTYSPEQVIQWVSRTSGSRKYFTSQFRKTFGVSMGEVWKNWIEWEHQFQRVNLDSLQLFPQTPYRDLSKRALGSVSRTHFDPETEELYAGVNYPGVVGHIAAVSTRDGSVRKLKEVKGPGIYFVTSLAFDPESRTLFYTADNSDWRDLHSIDLETGKSRRLMKDVRVGDLVFDGTDGSLWGVRHYNGISTLVRIPHPYDEWDQIHSWPYGQVMYDIDISPDGSLLSFSLGEISGRQTLRIMDVDSLLGGSAANRTLYDFDVSLPSSFVFSPEGRYLYGSSYYTGVSNIWRYDLAADSMDVVSNCESGFFRPTPLSPDSLIVLRYTGEGFVPAVMKAIPLQDVSATTFLGQVIEEKHPIVREWNVGSPLEIPLDSLTTYSGNYRSLRHMGLASIYPVVEGYKDFAAVGLHLAFSDPGYVNDFGLTVSYTPDRELPEEERFHASATFERQGWRLIGKYNDADFYDLFGPTKTSRKGYAFGLGYQKNLIYDTPKTLDFDISVTRYGDMERLPDAQNVSASFDKLLASSAQISYKNRRASLGAVDYEKGLQWVIQLSDNHVRRKSHPRVLGKLDFGFPLPIHHSSVWLRSSAGYSPGDRDEPFANFYFGGFGNNWVDRGSIKRYRESYSLPGLELNEVPGTNYTKTMLEWNLPPVRFRRVGIPSFYVTWARTALFAAGLMTNLDSEAHRVKAASAGAQIDFRFTLLSHLNMTLSLGYAGGFLEGSAPSDEFMFSVKVL
jgi:hypothetical protein